MKKKKTLAGLYKEKSIIGSKAKIKSFPIFEDLNYVAAVDNEQEFTICDINYRVDQDGKITPVFILDELKQTPNLRFRADQLWITEVCGESIPQYTIWVGTGDISNLSESIKHLTPCQVAPLRKTKIEYREGDSIIILIPKESLLKARKDNGFCSEVEFEEFNGDIEIINGLEYKVYGQTFQESGVCYIYID